MENPTLQIVSLALMVIVFLGLLYLPIWITRSRRVSEDAQSTVALLIVLSTLLVGITVWLSVSVSLLASNMAAVPALILWLIALVWACVAPVAPIPRRQRVRPMSQAKRIDYDEEAMALAFEGPGLYEIRGVDKATGYDVVDRIQADSKDNAMIKASLRGIVVSSCRLSSSGG